MLNNNNYYPGAQGINIPPRAPIYNAPPTGLKGRPVSSIEAREGHLDKETKMKELDKYMNDLTQDIVEMINDLSQEEKDMIRNKMAGLVNRI